MNAVDMVGEPGPPIYLVDATAVRVMNFANCTPGGIIAMPGSVDMQIIPGRLPPPWLIAWLLIERN